MIRRASNAAVLAVDQNARHFLQDLLDVEHFLVGDGLLADDRDGLRNIAGRTPFAGCGDRYLIHLLDCFSDRGTTQQSANAAALRRVSFLPFFI